MFDNADWANVLSEETDVTSSNQYIDLPEGDYNLVVDGVYFDPASQSKNGKDIPPFVRYELFVSDGEFKGMRTTKKDGFWNARSASFIKRDILRVGCVPPQNMEEIPVALKPIIGKVVAVHVSVKQGQNGVDFRNIYFNSLVGDAKGYVPRKETPEPVQNKTIEPMSDLNKNRLKDAASVDPFGGVFDGDVEPPF